MSRLWPVISQQVKIGLIGDYDCHRPSHQATVESLSHAALFIGVTLEYQWFVTVDLAGMADAACLSQCDGLWGAPGEVQSSAGVIRAIEYARVNDIPYLGT